MFENKEKMAGYDPYWSDLIVPLSEKANNSINLYGLSTGDASNNQYLDKCRISQVPQKIWVAVDDGGNIYKTSENYIRTLKNGGCIADLRTFEAGLGGHHAVDNDVNAPKVDSIKTLLGIIHTNVPLAYKELVDFFEQYK